MINIFDLYENVKARVNVQQGGHIKPSTFVQWVHNSQLELFSELVQEFQKTQFLSEKIMPFLVTKNVFISQKKNSTWDIVKTPTEYECISSARIVIKKGEPCACSNYGSIDDEQSESKAKYIDLDDINEMQFEKDSNNCEVSIKIVTNDRWGSICKHKTKMPRKDAPIMSQFSEGYRILPKGVSTVIIVDFFKKPESPIFNFSITNEGTEDEYIQYVPTGSKHLEWSEIVLEDLLSKIQQKYDIFTK